MQVRDRDKAMSGISKALLVLSCSLAVVSLVMILVTDSSTTRALEVVSLAIWLGLAAMICFRPGFVDKKDK